MEQYNPPNNQGTPGLPAQAGAGSASQGGASGAQAPSPRSGAGPIVGVIIIIVILLFGAFYLWNAGTNPDEINPPPLILGNDQAAEVGSDTSAGLPPQSSSDEADDILADIEAMNIDAMNSQTAGSLETYEAATQE